MWQHIIRDYFRAYRWNNIKRTWKISQSTGYIVMGIMFFSIVMLTDTYETMIDGATVRKPDFNVFMGQTDTVLVFAYIVPVIFIWLSIMVHPVRLPKMMYLCPMDRKERTEYVYNSFRFRIIFSMVIASVGIGALILFIGFDGIAISALFINDLIFCMLIPSGAVHERNGRSDDKVNDWADIKMTLETFITMLGAFSSMAFGMFLINPEMSAEAKVGEVVLFVVMLMFEIPMVKGYRKYMKQELAAAICYEEWER